MFDNYVKSGPSHMSVTTTVHEHRAPTDDSVKLLREMETKAEEQIRKAFPLNLNTLEGTAFLNRDCIGYRHVLIIRYVLNGVAHEFKGILPWELKLTDQVVAELKSQFAAHLTETFLSDLTKAIVPAFESQGRF